MRADTAKDPELARVAQECSGLIVREVATLSALVNEFSQFVRFPTAKLEPTDANTAVQEALEVFSGRLDGIQLRTSLEENLAGNPRGRAIASQRDHQPDRQCRGSA